MRHKISFSLILTIAICISISSCAAHYHRKPHGTLFGKCEGTLLEDSGTKFKFVINVFREDHGGITPYLSIPSRGVRYAEIGEVSFDEDTIKFELDSPSWDFGGEIVDIKVSAKGAIENYFGSLMFQFEKEEDDNKWWIR